MEQQKPEFWNNNYQTNKTGWDIGAVSTPLKEYFDQISDKTLKILIPGAGNAYEAEYLWRKGFKNVFVLDFSEVAASLFLNRYPDFPKENVIVQDFFQHNGQYNLIIEQTFFSAIQPNQRKEYAEKMAQLLIVGGKLVGLLFNHPILLPGPPFGGTPEEYQKLFSPKYKLRTFETANNSIQAREGRELFLILEKKANN